MNHGDGSRRLTPRIWDTDWLVLRGLAAAIEDQFRRSLGEGRSLLDFGCGAMPYRSLARDSGALYVGADFGGCRGCDHRLGRLAAGSSGSVDVVLSVQVLEHVRDLDTLSRRGAAGAEPGGVMILSTHGTWLYHAHPEDHRRWTPDRAVVDIEARGFQVEEIEAIAGPLAGPPPGAARRLRLFLRRIPLAGRPLAHAGGGDERGRMDRGQDHAGMSGATMAASISPCEAAE